VLGKRLWARVLRVDRASIEDVRFDEQRATTDEGETIEAAVIVSVRTYADDRRRCGICRRRSAKFDNGQGQRRWRGLDVGSQPCFLEADAPRVTCRTHGVTVVAVPWARHASRFTKDFEDQVAWLASESSGSAVAELMRISWRSVGAIVARVAAEARSRRDPLEGLSRIGIDEISHRKGHRYLVVVVDHDTGRLVWAAPGRDEATVGRFFDDLGEERAARLTHVSADAASWIAGAVASGAPQAILCVDPFHVVSWVTDALDEVRRDVWNQARRSGNKALAGELKGARYALWKNPEHLSSDQRFRLAIVAKINHPLYKAYLLKEQLRLVFRLPTAKALALLDSWLAWASRSRLAPFVEAARTIRAHRGAIEATLRHRLSNALVESTNTKIRLIARRAFGFHHPEALIGLAMLSLGGLCPPLPGRGVSKAGDKAIRCGG
jgi:transposase